MVRRPIKIAENNIEPLRQGDLRPEIGQDMASLLVLVAFPVGDVQIGHRRILISAMI